MFKELYQKYDDICKCWIGPCLFIILSKPEYIERIGQEYFKKVNRLMKIASGDGVASMDAGKRSQK